jgi:hypothetical protein
MSDRLLLDLLFPRLDGDHRIELRAIDHGRFQRRGFFTSVDEAAEAAALGAAEADVFFGVGARGPRDGGRREDVAYVRALWADVDAKCYGGKTAARDALGRTEPLASAVVDSGGGFHGYWLLDEPFRVDGDGARTETVEGTLRGLRDRLRAPGGPPLDACGAVSHALRFPGTLNHKEAYPRPVRAVEVHADRRYRFDDLSSLYLPPPIAAEIVPFGDDGVDGAEALARAAVRGLSWRMRDLVVGGGVDPYPSRSERDQAVVVALLASGSEPDDVRAIFAEYPVGERYRERGSGDAYLTRSIGKARAHIASQPGRRVCGALPAEVTERVAVELACRELASISGALPATRRELQRRLRRSRATVEKYLAWGVRLGWYRRAAPAVTGPGRPAARYELVGGVRPRVHGGAAYAQDVEAVATLRQAALEARGAGGVRL